MRRAFALCRVVASTACGQGDPRTRSEINAARMQHARSLHAKTGAPAWWQQLESALSAAQGDNTNTLESGWSRQRSIRGSSTDANYSMIDAVAMSSSTGDLLLAVGAAVIAPDPAGQDLFGAINFHLLPTQFQNASAAWRAERNPERTRMAHHVTLRATRDVIGTATQQRSMHSPLATAGARQQRVNSLCARTVAKLGTR